VLLTIDFTEPVLDEALEMKAGAIVSYHPPIWDPLQRVTDGSPRERIVLRAIESGVAIYSPHTALDAAPGGMTDWLCEGIAGTGESGRMAGDCRALAPAMASDPLQDVKIVTFLPESAVDHVRASLASAGAGTIGAYKVCSFATLGSGTFFAEEGANPTVGAPGRLEHVAEVRLEMVCSKAALPLAITTLRQFHPYEEPAFDVYQLLPKPDRAVGAGRRIVLDQPVTVTELAKRVLAHLDGPFGRPAVRIAHAFADRQVSHVGVVPGAGASLAAAARAEGCEVFVTGEMKHHEVIAAVNSGMSVIVAGHTNTERGYLPRLAKRLGEQLGGVSVRVARSDTDPLVSV